MRKYTPLIAMAAVVSIAGCGSSKSPSSGAGGSGTQIKIQKAPATGVAYRPRIVPAEFTTHFTSHYWPLRPGAQSV